jgi:nucleoside-diphosphate-sugar epimerase
MASLITNLLDKNDVMCSNPGFVRDYLHVKDVASAFVTLLECQLQGPVNIGSGQGVKLSEIVNIIEQKLSASGRVGLTYQATASKLEPALLVAATSKLEQTGWMPEFNLDSGLEDTISWWRAQRLSGDL